MKFVKYELNNFIGIITISRINALNALNKEMLNELDCAINSLCESDIKCLVIKGDGEKAFVAGADIVEMNEMSKEEALEFSKTGNMVFEKIHMLPFPTIAMVNGYALGGGCELALACDIRICSKKAVFGQPETGLGIIPGFGGTQRLSRIVGVSKAKQIIFSAQSIDASESYRIGLVNEIYDEDVLYIKTIDLANAIVRNSPLAISYAKKAIDVGIQLDLKDGLTLEEKLFSESFEAEDQIERMKAFLEKRKRALKK